MPEGNGGMEPAKRRLTDLSQLVHNSLRKLKLEDTATIPMKDFAYEEVRNYVWAYGLHKKKWFHLRHDKTANVVHAERGVPPWEQRASDDDPDEP